MADTIILSNPDSLQYQLKDFRPSLRDSVIQIITKLESGKASEHFSFTIFFSVILIMIAVICFILRLTKVRKNERIDTNKQKNNDEIGTDVYYYFGKDIQLEDMEIAAILRNYFPYYNFLSEELKAFFLQRLQQFMNSKIFRLPKEFTHSEIPVLLSAAATQLTFGLHDFHLFWFVHINVNATECFSHPTSHEHLLAGNVEGRSVNIAWNHFLTGIHDSEDGINLGLHELAHALYYEYIAVDKGFDTAFAKHLRIVMKEIVIIYNAGESTQCLFSSYAFRNTQECWAESVELFFEKPDLMQETFPKLFDGLTQLLRQNPLDKTNPIILA